MERVVVGEFKPADTLAAAEVLAQAYSTNPIHIAIFRKEDADLVRRKALYKAFLEHIKPKLITARLRGRLVGILGMADWPTCQMTPQQAQQLGPILSPILGEALPRYREWRAFWAQRDPKEPHWHLGPVAVAPEFQRKGIGQQMLQEFCASVDQTKLPAYLETDRAENVPLYRKFGFAVVGEGQVLGVPNWFMTRPAKT